MNQKWNHKIPMVSLNVLQKATEVASGVVCHQYHAEQVSPTRVELTYSNEDEWACEHPMTAVYPCVVSKEFSEKITLVFGHLLRVKGDGWDGEGWQAFEGVWSDETLAEATSELVKETLGAA
jgi:hypothetical protein